MPELPEVETLCRQLHDRIAGEKILKTAVYDDKFASLESVRGCIIEAVRRSGKTIELRLNDGRSVAIHLRMTGRLFWRQDKKREPLSAILYIIVNVHLLNVLLYLLPVVNQVMESHLLQIMIVIFLQADKHLVDDTIVLWT